MMQTIEANWVAFAVALLAILVVGWLLLARARKGAPRREYKPDVLDQGAASVSPTAHREAETAKAHRG